MSQSVKETLQSLVDDGLVHSDKIGSSNCRPIAEFTNICAFTNKNKFSGASHRNAEASWVVFAFPWHVLSWFFQVRNRLATGRNAKWGHNSQVEELEASIEREKAVRPESVCFNSLVIVFFQIHCSQAQRSMALEKLSAAKEQIKALEAELRAYGACDPIKVEAKRRAVILAHEAAIRWTGLRSVLLSAVY